MKRQFTTSNANSTHQPQIHQIKGKFTTSRARLPNKEAGTIFVTVPCHGWSLFQSHIIADSGYVINTNKNISMLSILSIGILYQFNNHCWVCSWCVEFAIDMMYSDFMWWIGVGCVEFSVDVVNLRLMCWICGWCGELGFHVVNWRSMCWILRLMWWICIWCDTYGPQYNTGSRKTPHGLRKRDRTLT